MRSRTASRKWRGYGEEDNVGESEDEAESGACTVFEEDERDDLQDLTAQVRKLTVRSFILFPVMEATEGGSVRWYCSEGWERDTAGLAMAKDHYVLYVRRVTTASPSHDDCMRHVQIVGKKIP